MRVALTGGTGFIGKRVVSLLRQRGHEVVCVVRNPEKASGLAALGAQLSRGDILDPTSLRTAFSGCEGVLHIAASYELGVVGKAAAEALAKNLEGTRNALEAARDAKARKIVYTSSIVVYGTTRGSRVAEGATAERIEFPSFHPTFYAYSKAKAHYEVAVPMMEAGVPIVIVQPGAVFGPRDHSSLRVLWALMAYGFPLVMGRCRYGVVDVEDCALGHVLALEKGTPGQCYHLVDENLMLADLARRAGQASGIPARLVLLPDVLFRLGAIMLSLLERLIPLPEVMSSDFQRGMTSAVTLDVETEKARRELGWTPRAMSDALREVMADELQRRGRQLPALLTGVQARLD